MNYDNEHEPTPDPYGKDSKRADKAIVKGIAIALMIWSFIYYIINQTLK